MSSPAEKPTDMISEGSLGGRGSSLVRSQDLCGVGRGPAPGSHDHVRVSYAG